MTPARARRGPTGSDDWLVEVGRSAAAASGVSAELLGDFLPMLAQAAGHGRRPGAHDLDAVRDLGRRAAEQGVGPGQTVELYLTAAWRLWQRLPLVLRSDDSEKVRAAAAAVLRALDDAVAALVESHQAVRRQMIRHEEALRREFVDDLFRGDADIALRPVAFQQQAVFQRELARVGFGLYASGEYLQRHGRPDFARRCAGHVLLLMDEDVPTADTPWLRRFAADARIGARTNGREALAAMAGAGIGLACLPRLVGAGTAGLELLAPPVPLPERRLWLGVHRDVRRLARVRAAIDHLRTVLRRAQPELLGSA